MSSRLRRSTALLLLPLLAVAGCTRGGDPAGAGGDSDRPTLTVWVPSGAEGEQPKAVAAAYNDTQDAVTIDVQDLPQAQSMEDVVLASIAAKNTPDLLFAAAPLAVPQYAESGGIVDLSTIEGATEFVEARSGADILEQYSEDDGGLYQVPWRSNPVMTYYNKALFAKAGLDPETPPRTYTEYLDAMAALDAAGITAITPSIDQTWWHRFFDFYPTYLAAGQQLFLDEAGTQAVFDDTAGKQAMEFWRTVYSSGYAPKATVTLDQANPFNLGESAMYLSGPFNLPLISPEVLGDIGVTTVPVPDDVATDGPPTTFGDVKSIVMFSTTDDEQGAWDFVEYYLSPENDVGYLTATRQIPLRADLADVVPAELLADNPLLEPFIKQGTTTLNFDVTPHSVEIFEVISNAYQAAAIYETMPVDQALTEAAAKVDKLVGN